MTAAELHLRILAHPDAPDYTVKRDNELRLAYAAAITPENPARAELIRLQIELHDAPTGGWRAARVRKLLSHHGRGWSAVTDHVSGFRFHRGFVGHVTLSARELLDRGERLFALEPITEVALRGGTRELAEAVFASPLLARLRALDLAGQGLGDAGAARLAASPYLGRLTALNLDGNRLTAAGLRALAHSHGLGNLRLASISGNLDDITPLGEGGELPPLAEQLEEEQAARIPWLHAGSEWAASELEAAALVERLSA